ncbi:uclacyanin-3-like [Rhododendron vialii]|uniref:uclacyanin-3-like n=1 Tax=Rhododendron vialii TaxID=182163 RepID=UPI00265E2C27|nr:uclacyanin-3-like [Rhododendron vialii]
MAMAMAAVLLLFVLAAPAVHSLQYNVTWNLEINYNSWAAGKTFTVGDTLVFTYTTEHAVDVVDQSEYASCNSWNALHSYTGGQTAISLATSGPMYFLCPIQGHCQAGMKLGITVVAAAASPTAPTTTPPPTSTTTPKPPASATTPKPPASTTTPTSTPSPSPSVSPAPTVTSPSGSPSSSPSPTASTTPVFTAAASSPKSSSGAGGMIGNMGSLVVTGFSVVVAGLVGFMG